MFSGHKFRRRALMLAGCASLVLASPALAQTSKTTRFDIPAEDLGASLNRVAQQSQREIVFNADVARGRRAPALHGEYTPEQALAQLLAGTGLKVRTTASGALAVEASDPQSVGARVEPRPLQSAETIEEVVVTAQKRSEKLRDVAGSLTALTAKDISRLGITTLSDYAAFVPGLSTIETAPGVTQVTLRGVTTGASQQTATVATYIDDVPYGSSISQSLASLAIPDIDSFDIDRIEVLRGPQGTLYGASSMGGLLKYVTTQPDTNQWAARVQTEVGGTDGGGANGSVRGMVNAPLITDRLALRASGYYRSQSGFLDDVGLGISDENSYRALGGRASLLFKATDDLTIRLSSMVERQKNGGAPSQLIDSTTLEPIYGDLKTFNYVRQSSSQLVQVHSLTINWNLGWSTLTSTTGYADRNLSMTLDGTPSFGPIVTAYAGLLGFPLTQYPVVSEPFNTHTKKITEEIRLASPSNHHLEWMVGLFYTHEHNQESTQVYANSSQVALPPLLSELIDTTVTSPFEEIAVFGNVDYYVTDKFDVDFGMRWSSNSQRFRQSAVGLFSNPAAPTTPSLVSQDSDDTSTTFRIAPRWRPNDAILVYATASSGYRPGGPNPAVLSGLNAGYKPPTYGPDSLWNYELGVRSTLLDKRLQVDVSVFDIEWKDIQLMVTTPTGMSYTGNGSEARSQGVELTSSFTPTRGLVFGVNAAYTDAKLLKDAPGLGAVKGDPLASVPKWTAALTGDYSFPVFGDWKASVGATWRYTDARNSGYTNSALIGSANFRIPSYQVVDLRASLTRGTWVAELFGSNLTNERGPLYISLAAQPHSASSIVMTPRTFGVRLTTSF